MRVFIALMALACTVSSAGIVGAQSHEEHDNAEIARLFEADQSIRADIKPEQCKDPSFVTRLIEGDRARRDRTRSLLFMGKLRTANDFYYAAFVFQHGNSADDYLLAHSLALASASRVKKDAAWIAAATLDRYLQSIGQKQIYGTQYLNSRETGPTMDPYDRKVVPDALRASLGVPLQAEQEERLARLKATGTLTK